MPKGWVLLSSSSEEEEFEVQEDDGKTTAADRIEGPSKHIVEAPEPQTTSSPLPRMSEAHAQRHDEPCHAMKVNSIKAVINKHHSFSKEENIAVISSAKSPSDHPHSVLTPEYEAVTGMTTDNNKSPRTRSQGRRATTEQPASVASKLESPADSPPGISYSGTTSESSLATEQNDIVNDKPLELVPSEVQNIVVSQVSPTPVYNPDDQHPVVMEFGTLKEPDPETQRVALETSNYIHGTAFSFGHPDPRTSWKPKYNYSEVDGWL